MSLKLAIISAFGRRRQGRRVQATDAKFAVGQ
jgi:hypothetical protein